MKIFPHSLVRFGGDSFEAWANLNSEELFEHLTVICKLQQDKLEYKEKLCDDMFSYIESMSDSSAQNLLQNLRRDIFNSRKLKNSKIAKAKEILDDELNQRLQTYLDVEADIKTKLEEGETKYSNATAQAREKLKHLANSDATKKGLLLSSKSLLERLPSYTERDVNSFRKKEVQIEHGLIKYLTRMYAKTSPFSTFTNLATADLGTTVNSSIESIHLTPDNPIKGHIRLNNQLFRYLLDLLKNYKPVYLQFNLRPNPTLIQENENYLYLTNNNNIESFQRIPLNPVVELILDIVNEKEIGISFKALVESMLESIDAEQEELEEYVMQLINYGCLEYNIGVSGIDPDWDIKFTEKLNGLPDQEVEHLNQLVSTLTDMRQMGTQYEAASVEERTNLLQSAFDLFRGACMAIHESAGLPEEERRSPEERQAELRKQQEEAKEKEKNESVENEQKETKEEDKENQEDAVFKHETSTHFHFKPEQIFYEDTTREAQTIIDQNKLEGFIEKLDGLLQSFSAFKGMQEEKDTMHHYFIQKYGEGKAIDLLVFYEDYYRDYKRPQNELKDKKTQEAREKNALQNLEKEEKEEKENENLEKRKEALKDLTKEIEGIQDALPFKEVPALKDRTEIIEKWNIAFSKKFPAKDFEEAEERNITLQHLESINQEIGLEKSTSNSSSFGSFIQFFEGENGSLEAVLNSSFSGYGKMLSRFLHILDPAVTEGLRKWNVELCGEDTMFIEDCDASYFNANLHPPLMPFEIWMPGGHNTLPEKAQIPITDFELVHESNSPVLTLRHKPSGKNAHVFDLGFQGHMGRSQLFQLLEKFSKAEYLSPNAVSNAINYPRKEKDQKDQKEEKKEQKITIQPRIIYENQIILQRKSWLIPKVLIPARDPMDSDWKYYLKLNDWRTEMGIPDEVFVFINPNRWNTTMDPKLAQKLTRDDYKPQYIDFRNPLLIQLLEKLITKVPASLKIQEMLPNSSQMMEIDGQRFVSEFVVQWYK